jgi:hypothetical protein
VADVITGIPELLDQGSKFTYANFSPKGDYGYPNALGEDWLIWTHRVSQIVSELGASPIRKSIQHGLAIELVGNGEDDFKKALASILNGLRAAQKVYGEPIPAADRTVSLGHNSPQQKQVLEKIDELIAAVEQTNEFPGDSDDKDLVVAELSAGRRLLQAANVRIAALRETLQPAIRFIMEKAAGSIIGKIANSAWDLLTSLHFW